MNESQRAWLGEMPKFSCLCCGADVRKIYPALGTLFSETDRFSRDNSHAGAVAGAAGDGHTAVEWAQPLRRWRDQPAKQK